MVMKVILVDAINCFFLKKTGIFKDMFDLLEEYPNRKIILTGANDEDRKKYNFFNLPYGVFTLEHDPEKTDPKYYGTLLERFNLKAEDVIYFEHNENAVKSAESVGIKTYFYDKENKDLLALKKFLDENLN
jgi:HAD superfamily hydrolase (TIGR01509 family)